MIQHRIKNTHEFCDAAEAKQNYFMVQDWSIDYGEEHKKFTCIAFAMVPLIAFRELKKNFPDSYCERELNWLWKTYVIP